jgi:hypothetical protein
MAESAIPAEVAPVDAASSVQVGIQRPNGEEINHIVAPRPYCIVS